jgi:glucan-binding YG repeat protein
VKKLLKKCTVLLLTAAMSITALPVTAWAETPAESAVMGAETATDHVDENAVDEKQAAGTEQRLNYMYIDQPYLETPNTQKVVVSWGDGSEGIEQMTATVQGPVGEEVWTAAQETDDIYLFERAYTEQERGVYSVTELHVAIAGNVYDYSLADLGIEALFGVDEKYEGIEELQPVSEEEVSADIAAYNIDESGNVTEQSSIEEAIVQAEQEIPAMMSDDGVQTQSSNIVVALDPGHDSTHAGASANGVREEVLTLKIAQYCKAELEEYAGVSVYMTRTTADCPHPGGSSAHDIDQRVADAAAAGASVYVSFHLNSSLSSAAKGAEIIIPNTNWKPQVGNDGKKLATLIESELVGLGLEERKIYSKNTTVNERYEDGSLSDYFTVQISAKEHGIPGIIVEHAFVTNTSDVNNFLNNEAGLKKLGVADATGIAKYFGLSKGQWYKDYTGWWYAFGTSYLKNQWAQISGSWYYFDFNGYMETGWQKISGKWSYLGGTDDGIMRIGWQKIGTNWYYFNSSGYMLTGWQKIGTKWYYFGESDDGAMRIGWQKIGGDRYYFGEANDGAMKTGWQKIGESWYYLGSSNGGYLQTGWQKIGGAWYYFSDKENGAMKTGWQKVGSTWYYLGSADDGYMQTGWKKLGTNCYYFGESNDGAMRTGFAKVGGAWYYFGGTDDGAMKNGWQKVGSTWYYLGSADDGYMQTGWKKLGTNWYYFGESNDGAMRTGFAKVGGDWYYFGGTDDGAMKTGWQKIDGTWYFFNDDGMYDSTKKYDEIPGINDDKINGSAGTNNSNTNSNVVEGTYLIEGDTEVTVDQMVAYFEASKKAYPEDVMRKGGAATIRDFCQIYYEEAVAEGIKAEVAFVQAMKETGWLQFTGVVKAEQYNFAGMGATGNSVSGESFKDVREGVRAQIQHLKAYGSTKSLNQTCVDNRFKYVERGSAIYVEWLSIPNNPKKKGWAAAKGYGVDIVKMIQKLKKM